MALVYSYVRFSSRKQLEGDSLRRQVERSDAWIARNGHTLADAKLHDLGKSGFSGKNLREGAALWSFLDWIKTGRVKPGDILLVENLDRLSRQKMNDAKKVFEDILSAGVLIATLMPDECLFTSESISDPFGLMRPLMAFYVAHVESQKKADRLRKKWDGLRAAAKIHDEKRTGRKFKFNKKCPAWLTWDEDKQEFVRNPLADAVRYIFDRCVEGAGQKQILKELVAKFPPPPRSAKMKNPAPAWTLTYIGKVLNDVAVQGILVPKTSTPEGGRVVAGPPIPGYYPEIISEDLYTRAQGCKAAKFRMRGPNAKFVNLFTGLVKNAHDGHQMHVFTGRKKRKGKDYIQRRLVSYGHLSQIPGSDPVSVMLPEFESLFLRHVSELRPEDLLGKTGFTELRAAEQELIGAEQKLARVEQDMATAGDDEYTSLRNTAKFARQRRDQLKAKVERLKLERQADRPLEHAQQIISALDTADADQRHVLRQRLRSLIAEMIEDIYVKPEKHLGRVYTAVQINYRSGLIRQFFWGPGANPVKSGALQCPNFGYDLRDKKQAEKKRFGKMAAMLRNPAPAPEIDILPDALGAAAYLWLQWKRSETAKGSFRVIPPQIQRFVEYVGTSAQLPELGKKDWDLFVRHIRAEVVEKKLAPATGRVTVNRVREMLRWFFDKGAVTPFDLGAAAAKLI